MAAVVTRSRLPGSQVDAAITRVEAADRAVGRQLGLTSEWAALKRQLTVAGRSSRPGGRHADGDRRQQRRDAVVAG